MFSPPLTMISFLRSNNLNVVVPIQASHIPGVEPSALHRSRRGLCLAPVSFHHPVASRHNLAHCGAIVRYILPVRIDHSKFYAGNGKPGHGLAEIEIGTACWRARG